MKVAAITVFSVFLLLCTIGCNGATGVQDGRQKILPTGEQFEHTVLTNIASALASTDGVARVYFDGPCNRATWGELLLPVMNVHIPSKEGGGLESVREMFRDVSDVVVSEDRPGIVIIKIGNVSGGILDTKLTLLLLNQDAQYNVNGGGNTIATIEKAEEFKAASAKLKVNAVAVFHDSLQQPPLESLPHLPPTFQNMTVDQVLDSIAKTFRGVVVYGECKGSNGDSLFDIEFKRFDVLTK